MSDRPPRTCPICQTIFVRKANRQKFCSKKCYRRNTYLNFYAIHAERKREKNRKYYQDTRDEQLAYRKRWYQEKGRDREILARLNNPWFFLLGAARDRAKKKCLPFDLTDAWARERWTGFCELSKLPFIINEGYKLKSYAPSIDRIKPELGYIQTNCRFILRAVNSLKSDGTDDDLYKIVSALHKNKLTC